MEKAARSRRRPRGAVTGVNARAQVARADFVAKNGLSCFKCGACYAEWGKTGVSSRGPWAICLPCIREGASSGTQRQETSDVGRT